MLSIQHRLLRMRRPLAAVALTLALALAAPAHAGDEPERVDAGASAPASGARIELVPRPDAQTWPSACSFVRPICVHSATVASPIAEALADTERAWDTISQALGVPPPLAAFDTGRFDVYLIPNADESTRLLERDPRSGYDRATGFAIVGAGLRGCALDAAITRQVLRGALLRASPATDAISAIGTSAALAQLIVPCGLASDTAAIGAAQAHPASGIVDALTGLPPRSASLFYGWLDEAFARSPGAAITATWALSPTRTPIDADHWFHEPDTFDVLRASFKGALSERSTLDDLIVGFGVARAFVGRTSDDGHFLESRTLGDAATVALAWDVPWPSQPRGLASPVGLAPTGSAYVLVHREGAAPTARLRIESSWEQLMKLRWVAVKLDATGHELARIPVATPDKAESVALTVDDLSGAASVLLVGTNVSAWDGPLEPDETPWEPHGWLLTIAAE